MSLLDERATISVVGGELDVVLRPREVDAPQRTAYGLFDRLAMRRALAELRGHYIRGLHPLSAEAKANTFLTNIVGFGIGPAIEKGSVVPPWALRIHMREKKKTEEELKKSAGDIEIVSRFFKRFPVNVTETEIPTTQPGKIPRRLGVTVFDLIR